MIERIANDVVPVFRTVDSADIRQLLSKHMLAITVCVYHLVQAGEVAKDPIGLVTKALCYNDDLQADVVKLGTMLSVNDVGTLQPAALLTASIETINAVRQQFGDRKLGRIALEELHQVMPVPGYLKQVSA